MEYSRIDITAKSAATRAHVMLIYTGGTFGMTYTAEGTLVPFNFSQILDELPTLRNLHVALTVIAFKHPIDSSDVQPEHWQSLAGIIADNYEEQDGFVVLHGTDTMAFTASALSFMLRGLAKPVVFTGAQLPIREPRSDARENLITAIEIAAHTTNGLATVPEVCIYFDYQLLRGNRARKVESMHFDAFRSENYPALAEAGVKIEFNHSALQPATRQPLRVGLPFDCSVAVLKIFPGMTPAVAQAVLQTPGLKALIIETFGAGNAPTSPWFVQSLADAIRRGLVIVNVSQCPGGMVLQGKYETSRALAAIGVVSGADITLEAAITKLMWLLANGTANLPEDMACPLAGEMTAL
jgi:L-asparaginase